MTLVLLGAAVIHKIHVVRRGASEYVPLIRIAAWRRRHASTILVGAAVTDSLVATLLIASPAIGFGLAAALLLAYALELRRLPPESECHCFGGFLGSSSGAAGTRNLFLASANAAGLVVTLIEPQSRSGLSASSIGITLVVLAVFAGIGTVRGALRTPLGTRREETTNAHQ